MGKMEEMEKSIHTGIPHDVLMEFISEAINNTLTVYYDNLELLKKKIDIASEASDEKKVANCICCESSAVKSITLSILFTYLEKFTSGLPLQRQKDEYLRFFKDSFDGNIKEKYKCNRKLKL